VEPGPAITSEPSARPDPPPAPARQRWRLVLARGVDAPALAGRELADAFEEGLEASGLPFARAAGRARTRVAFGAPLPLGVTGERELADVLLTELAPVAQVRDRIGACVPEGWRLVDLFDVWLGAPALAGQVAAADYRIAIDSTDPAVLATACEAILEAKELPRERAKGTTVVAYDLRPLLADVRMIDAGPPACVRARTRFDPIRGTGRPEEVVAALGDRLGAPLEVVSIVRERLILADEPG
jgi:radical SAM-linked protein